MTVACVLHEGRVTLRKACSRCGVIKTERQFFRKAAASDGRRSECKLCSRIIVAAARPPGYFEAYRAAHLEHLREYARRYAARTRYARALKQRLAVRYSERPVDGEQTL